MSISKTFLLVFGPPAVGKMTIGQELEQITGFKLFHNHMIIDPLLSIFGKTDLNLKNLIFKIRTMVFEAVIQGNIPGLIFTFVWNFDEQFNSKKNVDIWFKIFNEAGWNFYCVELLADLETRVIRNKSQNRIKHKASKQNIIESEKILLLNETQWIMQSEKNFTYGDKFVRIQNGSDKNPQEIAKQIKLFFNL